MSGPRITTQRSRPLAVGMSEPELLINQLIQDEVWLDAEGRVHRIEDMRTGHIVNSVAYVQRRAAEIETLAAVGRALDGDLVLDEPRWSAAEPMRWLNGLPAMRKFKAVLLARGEEVAW